METVRNLDMTPPAPSGRTDAFLKAVRHTLWDFLTGKNSFRSFQDRYRFNIIRWSASHFRTPSLMERAILLLRTENPLKMAYEDFQRKYAHLLGRWEMEAVRKVNLTLIELGRTPFYPHKRNIDRMLDDVYKGIKKLQGYKGCPDMENERLLLATYRYMFAAPSDRRYGTLCPDELCGMLEQHGVDRRELCRQNYGGLFRDGTTALYETETDGNGNRYLRPSGHIRLERSPTGWSMHIPQNTIQREKEPAVSLADMEPSKKVERVSRPSKKKKTGQRKTGSVKIRQ